MTILGVHHVNITIPKNEERAGREFYCSVLGLREIDKPDALRGRGGFWLELGALQIHISTEADVDRWRTKAHVAYQVDDLSRWRQQMTELEIVLEEQPPFMTFERFLIRDPFGNRIEFIQHINPSSSLVAE